MRYNDDEEISVIKVDGGYMVEYFNYNLKDRRILVGTTQEEAAEKLLNYLTTLQGDTDEMDT